MPISHLWGWNMLRSWLTPHHPASLQQKIANAIVVVVLILLLGLGSISLWFALQQQQQALQRLNGVSEHWLTLQLRQQLAQAFYPLLPEHPGQPPRLQIWIQPYTPPGQELTGLGTLWSPPAATQLQLYQPKGLLSKFPPGTLEGIPSSFSLPELLRPVWQGQAILQLSPGDGRWLVLAVPMSDRSGRANALVALLMVDLTGMLDAVMTQPADSPDLNLRLESIQLRPGLAVTHADSALSVSLVITSYSIHYTKLYESSPIPLRDRS